MKPPKYLIQKKCKNCGDYFLPPKTNTKYCIKCQCNPNRKYDPKNDKLTSTR